MYSAALLETIRCAHISLTSVMKLRVRDEYKNQSAEFSFIVSLSLLASTHTWVRCGCGLVRTDPFLSHQFDRRGFFSPPSFPHYFFLGLGIICIEDDKFDRRNNWSFQPHQSLSLSLSLSHT